MNQEYPATTGYLVAIGGAEDKTSDLEILRRVIELAPSAEPEVAVIVTASGVPQDVFPEYEAAFTRLGASAVHALDFRHRRDALEEPRVDIVERCDVIFFSGGDQMRLTNVLGGSPVLDAIRERYFDGAVIAGTSAGAVALSTTMIYGDGSVDALHKGGVFMASGLGFVEGLCIDSHFLERGRFTRLMEAGAANPEHLGVGLGEDAGVIIHINRVLEAIGPGHVIIIDSRDLASSNVADVSNGDPVAIEHVIMHALIQGYGFDIDNRRYLVPEAVQASVGGN
jgi:cyanophycinase